MSKLLKLLTNESFLGTFALSILGGIALYQGHSEMAGIALGGIAAMLRGKEGEKHDQKD